MSDDATQNVTETTVAVDGPNPQALSDEYLTPNSVETYKRYKCIRYLLCLDAAANAGWQQFHCNDCKVYVCESAEDTEVFESTQFYARVRAAFAKDR